MFFFRHYTNKGTGYEVVNQFSGKGYAPYDPTHNSTSLFTGQIVIIYNYFAGKL